MFAPTDQAKKPLSLHEDGLNLLAGAVHLPNQLQRPNSEHCERAPLPAKSPEKLSTLSHKRHPEEKSNNMQVLDQDHMNIILLAPSVLIDSHIFRAQVCIFIDLQKNGTWAQNYPIWLTGSLRYKQTWVPLLKQHCLPH